MFPRGTLANIMADQPFQPAYAYVLEHPRHGYFTAVTAQGELVFRSARDIQNLADPAQRRIPCYKDPAALALEVGNSGEILRECRILRIAVSVNEADSGFAEPGSCRRVIDRGSYHRSVYKPGLGRAMQWAQTMACKVKTLSLR